MTNKLYKDIALEVDIDAKRGAKNQAKETQATFYSYDIQSGIVKINIAKDGQPLTLSNGTEILINVVKLGIPQQKLVYTADIVDSTKGVAHWEIPESLIGYKGRVRAGVFINLSNGQRLHGGYFKFNMGISEIDTNLDEFEEDFWQGWDEFQKNVEATWSDWEAIRDDVWKKYVEKYEVWKKDQENKQTKFENDTEKRLSDWLKEQERIQTEFEVEYNSWKKEQEGKQTTFESDFADWENTQETKQKNFESETSQKITDINQTLETTDSQVQKTNNALENLDAYTKVETDEKLENLDVYSKQETDNKLAGKADKTAIDDLNKKVEIGERGFLTPEKGFENFNSEETKYAESQMLQYVRIGPICHIYGSVRNLGTLEKDSEVVVATLPYRLAIFMQDVKVSQGSSNNIFTAYAQSINRSNYSNQITISRFRDDNGENTSFEAGKWLNISLTVGVEVVD